jgi:asparagine synthase (glutamine-hydrolysing)
VVEERHPHLEAARHARPVHLPQDVARQVPREIEQLDLRAEIETVEVLSRRLDEARTPARDALYAPEAKQRGLFRTDYVDALLADPNGELTRLRGNKLWQLGLLELWLQRHGVA